MSEPWIICTDLDRTLLPNGEQVESTQARARFRALAADPNIIVVYASGRDYQLVEAAIEQWELPYPDYLIADVGSTIYSRNDGTWTKWESWRQQLSQNWVGLSRQQIFDQLPKLDGLKLQPEHQQGEFKLSFIIEPTSHLDLISSNLTKALAGLGIDCNCIPSINEHEDHGLIDILPANANKLLAIRFLMQTQGFNPEKLLYSGDSGNDMEVLASEFKSVLVANATDEIKQMALLQAQRLGNRERLYIATGHASDHNGCYASGIIEGFNYFFPEFNHLTHRESE
jgi:sucrose-6F-phosphate phosphohydrolase